MLHFPPVEPACKENSPPPSFSKEKRLIYKLGVCRIIRVWRLFGRTWAHFHHGEKNISKLKSPLHQVVNVLFCRALSTKSLSEQGVPTFFPLITALTSLRRESGIYDSWLKSLCSLAAKASSLALMEKEEGEKRNWDTNTRWAAGIKAQSCFILHLLLFGFETARRDELPSRRTCFLCLTTTGFHPRIGKKKRLSCQEFEKKRWKQTPALLRWPLKPDQRRLQLRFRCFRWSFYSSVDVSGLFQAALWDLNLNFRSRRMFVISSMCEIFSLPLSCVVFFMLWNNQTAAD